MKRVVFNDLTVPAWFYLRAEAHCVVTVPACAPTHPADKFDGFLGFGGYCFVVVVVVIVAAAVVVVVLLLLKTRLKLIKAGRLFRYL